MMKTHKIHAPPKSKCIVALDFSSQDDALALVTKLDPSLCALKVGSEMFTLFGADFVRHLIQEGYSIFLDLKFHDIPNTVAKACSAAAGLGVWMLNVHASGGLEMMKAAVNALATISPRPLLIAVTVLTSMDEKDIQGIGIGRDIEAQVGLLALLAKQAGCDGVVCSAAEVPRIKVLCGESFLTIVPGIRFENDEKDDQSRVMSPEKALELGADYLVIGRSIVRALEPLKLLQTILGSQ